MSFQAILGAPTDVRSLAFLGIAIALLIVFGALSYRGFVPTLRPMSGYEVLSRQVGEAVESGDRLHIGLGPNSIVDEETATSIAGLAVLDAAAIASARSDRSPVATTADPTTLLLLDDMIRRVYRDQEALQNLEQASTRLVALDPLTMAGALASVTHDDGVQGAILLGSYGAEVMLPAEAGERRGIGQVIGSNRLEGQAAAFAATPHSLIGEELYVARAYLHPDDQAKAAVATQDILRYLIIAALIVGAALSLAGLL